MTVKKNKNELLIHVVEDDPFYNKLLQHHLSLNTDNVLESFTNGRDFLKNLYKNPQIAILDYSLPDFNGAALLAKIKASNPEIFVIIVSGQEDISTAIKLLQEGACDYLVKNSETKERLWSSVQKIREQIALKEEISELKSELEHQYDFSETIIGKSRAMQNVYALVEKACGSNISVSLYGETGTGKEVVAKSIHYHSGRKKGRFVAVNVASIPRELIESELFGHEKGAFTGALARRIGRFEEADKGTLFLDEIGELDLPMQAKLLRVLQERELCRVGGNELIKFDTRVIIATHKNLAEEVKLGNFREDLYYRLLGLSIELPPLRDRGADIILLAKNFLKGFSRSIRTGEIKMTTEAQKKLMDYHYPGNVRELRSIIELACVMSDDGVIGPEHIKFSKISAPAALSRTMTLDEYNQMIINEYLEKYDHNVLMVAQKLNIGKSTIYRLLKSAKN